MKMKAIAWAMLTMLLGTVLLAGWIQGSGNNQTYLGQYSGNESKQMAAPVASRTYTSDADFDEGTMVAVQHDTVHDQLQLQINPPTTLPFIWVPNNEGTVSKVNTETGKEVGRYRVSWPDLPLGGNPSRTTVDLNGNCLVGLRQAGTAVKIGLAETGEWIDRNGNGVPDTSNDANNNGDIDPGEVLPFGQDEAVLYEVFLKPGYEETAIPATYPSSYAGYDTNYWGVAPRGFAVDQSNNVWVGTSSIMKYFHINGATGTIIGTVDLSPQGHRAYGAVLDENGILWSADYLDMHVLALNTTDFADRMVIPLGHTYGISLDYDGHLFVSGALQLSKIDVATRAVLWTKTARAARGVAATSDNNVWVAGYDQFNYYNSVSRYDHEGNLIVSIGGFNSPSGVAVDAAGKVWGTNIDDNYIRRIDPATNTIDFSKNLINSGGHYSYSDMTGIVARTITTKIGTWTVIFNSEAVNTPWGRISWTANEPLGTSVEVRVRSSNDQISWSAWEATANGVPLGATPNGRYLQIETTLQIITGTDSPVLYDLTVAAAEVPSTRGPRFDLLQFPIYASALAEFAAFDAGQINITDQHFQDPAFTKYSSMPFNSSVTLDPYTEFSMFTFDVNNNLTIPTYPGVPSPTADPKFRTALNYFVDRNTYVQTILGSDFAETVFTIGWPHNPLYYNTSAIMADYNPSAGDAALDAAGYTLGADPAWRDYPPWHPKAGQNLDPLIFYIRSDDSLRRLPIGRLFAAELVAHGIPVDQREVPRSVTRVEVMQRNDYHIYTGSWSLSSVMDWTYDLFHSSMWWGPDSLNYNHINDPVLDAYLEQGRFATTIELARQGIQNAQGRWQQVSPTYPLWVTKGYQVHHNSLVNTVNAAYCGSFSLVNTVYPAGVGSFNFWTFYGSHMNTSYNGGTLYAGLSSDVQALNPLYSQWPSDNYVLDQIYDTLLVRNPYTLADQPWMAQSWEIGNWTKGNDTFSAFTFHLRSGMKWHDGVSVTSADIKFTYDYVKNWTDSLEYNGVQFIDHVTASDPLTVTVYMNIKSVWSIHYIQIYMMPKHIWEFIADPHGFAPDPNLVGSGPWIGDARAPGAGGNPGPEGYNPGLEVILRANRNYMLYNHPKSDVNWDGIVDIYDIITVAVAFGSRPWQSNWDIKADIVGPPPFENEWYQIDIYDLILVAVNFGITWGP